MSVSVEVTALGDGAAVVLPKPLLDRLGVGPGDRLQVSETADGLLLTPGRSTFAVQMDAAERVMQRRAGLLRRLAE